jgi:drug/metabolite transporter (DMT)-like permease
MFIGESGCWLVVFLSYLYRRVRGPTDDIEYEPVQERDGESDDEDSDAEGGNLTASQTLVDPTNIVAKAVLDAEAAHVERVPLEGWKVIMLAAPSTCDICGTTLMNVGLLFVAASIYQMTRGALVLFVGLFSVIFLKRHMGGWKWLSLVIVVSGVAVVGLAGVLDNRAEPPALPGHTIPDNQKSLVVTATNYLHAAASNLEVHTAAETVLGFFLIAAAQVFTATQFVVEESIMEKYSMDPIKVVGWEGVFGSLVTLVGMGVLHAAVGQTDAGRGGYFDAREGFYQMFHHPAIAFTSLMIMVSIG